MVISHNLMAMNASRQYNITGNAKKKSVEKLSSGYKINRAADDAAGLSISEKMRKQIRGLDQGAENVQDGISMCQVADGALAEISDMLHRITELSVQAANGTNSDEDRQAIQSEVNEILQEIDRISETTTFNEKTIFYDDSERVAYEKAKRGLLDGNYVRFTEDVTLSNGQVLSKEEANVFASMLSNMAIASEFWNEFESYGKDFNDRIIEKIPMLLNNSMEMIGFSTDEFFVEGMDIGAAKLSSGINETSCREACDQYNSVARQYKARNTDERHILFGAAFVMATSTCIGCMDDSEEAMGEQFRHYLSISAAEECRYFLDYIGITGSETYDVCVEGIQMEPFSDIPYAGDYLSTAVTAYRSLFNEDEDDNQIWIQSGVEAEDGIGLYFGEVSTDLLGIGEINVSTQSGARASLDKTSTALDRLSSIRGTIGAQQNRLEHTFNNVKNTEENLQASESRIRDTDMAEEMVNYSKSNIIQQAAESMLVNANKSNQGVLTLLQ